MQKIEATSQDGLYTMHSKANGSIAARSDATARFVNLYSFSPSSALRIADRVSTLVWGPSRLVSTTPSALWLPVIDCT